MESPTCSEAPPPLLPIEEETTSSVSDNFLGLESGSWQTSYAADVLSRAALQDSDFGIYKTNWNDSNDPMDPKLFEELETKYSNGLMGSKSERKLLFDTIKTSLLEIFQLHVDSFPWVRPKLVDLYTKSEKEAVRDAMDALMSRDFSDMEASEIGDLDKEMEWSDVEGEINLIGTEMERMLIHDVISDLCSLYQ